MVTETGANLDIVILAEAKEDWQAFASWYSINHYLPDANITMICNRNYDVQFQSFQWAKRLTVRHSYRNPEDDKILMVLNTLLETKQKKYWDKRVLLIKTPILFVDVLNDIDLFKEKFILNDLACYFNGPLIDLEEIVNNYFLLNQLNNTNKMLYQEVKTCNKHCSIVSCFKGCGRWINTMKGCPFSGASGMLTENMTINEIKVNDLWRKMVHLYSAVH